MAPSITCMIIPTISSTKSANTYIRLTRCLHTIKCYVVKHNINSERQSHSSKSEILTFHGENYYCDSNPPTKLGADRTSQVMSRPLRGFKPCHSSPPSLNLAEYKYLNCANSLLVVLVIPLLLSYNSSCFNPLWLYCIKYILKKHNFLEIDFSWLLLNRNHLHLDIIALFHSTSRNPIHLPWPYKFTSCKMEKKWRETN